MTKLALLPPELAFWIGFALPPGPVVGLARTVLVVMALGRRRSVGGALSG